MLIDAEAPVEAFEAEIEGTVDAGVIFEEFAVEEGREVAIDEIGVIWLGAGEAVLWLDTESGLAVSSITISPGDPGESGGRSFVLFDDTCVLMQGFFELISSWHCNGRFAPATCWLDPPVGKLELLVVELDDPSPFVISSTILFLT